MQRNDAMMPEIVEGVKAAGLAAIEQARRTGTRLVIWQDGKIVEVTPDEAERMLRDEETRAKI